MILSEGTCKTVQASPTAVQGKVMLSEMHIVADLARRQSFSEQKFHSLKAEMSLK